MSTITTKTIITLASVSSSIAAIVTLGVKEIKVCEKTVRVYAHAGDKQFYVISKSYIEELLMAMQNRVSTNSVLKDMDVVYGKKGGATIGIDSTVRLVKIDNAAISAAVMNTVKEVEAKEVKVEKKTYIVNGVEKEKLVRTYTRTKKDQKAMDRINNEQEKPMKEKPVTKTKDGKVVTEIFMDDIIKEEVYARIHSGFNSVENYITCNCCMNNVGDILEKTKGIPNTQKDNNGNPIFPVNPKKAKRLVDECLETKMNKIVSMFERVGLVDERGYMKPVYGKNNNDAFKVFNDRAYADVVAKNAKNPVYGEVFKAQLAINRETRMKVAAGLQAEYWVYRNEMTDLWANAQTHVVGDKVSDGFDTFNVCPICGSSDVQIVRNGRKTPTITKDTIKEEAKIYGFKDIMSDGIYMEKDYVVSSERDLDVYNWVKEDMDDCAEYKYNCDRDEAEAEFFELAPHMSIDVVCKKLGRKSNFIADIIAEYYSVKMSDLPTEM
jgi:hypothetical protein